MTLLEAATRVARRSNKNINDTTTKARIIGHINDVCKPVWNEFPWTFRWREYALVTYPDVTSGTMTATNGSRTLTASGTPFASVYEGGWIRFPQESIQNWYKIKKINSTSEALLDPPYQGTTASGKEYELKKIDYSLPTEVWDMASINITYQRRPLSLISRSSMDAHQSPVLYKGPPRGTIYGSDDLETTYTTGTVTGTIDTITLTGTTTAWLENVEPGDSITIGDYTYIIHSVESDTSIKLYNHLKVAASGATYSISRQFIREIRLEPSADDNYTLFVRGLRTFANLVHDDDTNELLYRYPSYVIDHAVELELFSSPDNRDRQALQKALMNWDKAHAEDRSMTITNNTRPIFTGRYRRY